MEIFLNLYISIFYTFRQGFDFFQRVVCHSILSSTGRLYNGNHIMHVFSHCSELKFFIIILSDPKTINYL